MRCIYQVFILLFFLHLSSLSFGQLKKKYSESYNKLKEKRDGSYIIIDNDTLYGSYDKLTKSQVSNFCNNLNDEATIQMYKNIVYNNLDCGKYKPVLAKQWISEITIYLDKKLSNKVRKDFMKFFESIDNIENLVINFTNKKEKANYFITTTSDEIVFNKKNKSHPYNHITYNLLGDNNSKFYGGTLKINTEVIKDKSLILSKLKQLFFTSLGQFTLDKKVDDNSLLSYNYFNDDYMSIDDFKFLSLHYLKLYDVPLNCFFYNKFIKEIQSKCSNEK